MAFDKDPLDVALDIKRHFARTVASRDKPARIAGGYVLGVAIWWLVIFAGLSVAGMGWIGESRPSDTLAIPFATKRTMPVTLAGALKVRSSTVTLTFSLPA